jgi:hypothetical protein
MRNTSMQLALVALLLLPAVAAAQATQPAGAHSSSQGSAGDRFLARTAIGYMGMIPAAIAGAYIGGAIDGAYGDCQCDDPGLAGAFLGFFTGAMLGATASAASLSYDSECSYGRRWRRAIGGTALSLLAGGVVAGATGQAAVIILTPLASPIASAMALRPC